MNIILQIFSHTEEKDFRFETSKIKKVNVENQKSLMENVGVTNVQV